MGQRARPFTKTFNMAMNGKLPVLFICENNQYMPWVHRSPGHLMLQIYGKMGLSYDIPSENGG